MQTVKLTGLLALIALAATSLTACSSPLPFMRDDAESTLTDFAGIEQEYLDTLNNLEFPPDTPKPTRMEGEDETMSFKKGWGETRASQDWECAWVKEWLNTYTTDPARAEAALTELDKGLDMPYMKPPKADQSVPDFFTEMTDKARLGDPSLMSTNLELNCYYD